MYKRNSYRGESLKLWCNRMKLNPGLEEQIKLGF